MRHRCLEIAVSHDKLHGWTWFNGVQHPLAYIFEISISSGIRFVIILLQNWLTVARLDAQSDVFELSTLKNTETACGISFIGITQIILCILSDSICYPPVVLEIQL